MSTNAPTYGLDGFALVTFKPGVYPGERGRVVAGFAREVVVALAGWIEFRELLAQVADGHYEINWEVFVGAAEWRASGHPEAENLLSGLRAKAPARLYRPESIVLIEPCSFAVASAHATKAAALDPEPTIGWGRKRGEP